MEEERLIPARLRPESPHGENSRQRQSRHTPRSAILCIALTLHVYAQPKAEIAQGIKKGRISNPVTGQEASRPSSTKVSEWRQPPARDSPGASPGEDTVCGFQVPAGTDIWTNIIRVSCFVSMYNKHTTTCLPTQLQYQHSSSSHQISYTPGCPTVALIQSRPINKLVGFKYPPQASVRMQTLRSQQVPTAQTDPSGQPALSAHPSRPSQGVLPSTQKPVPPVMDAHTQSPPGPHDPKV